MKLNVLCPSKIFIDSILFFFGLYSYCNVELEDLDLSDNQITSWNVISNIIEGCNYLKILNISGNILDSSTRNEFKIPKSLKVLVYQRANITWDDVM